MILKEITPHHRDIPALKKLYEDAFPENERAFSMDEILSKLNRIPVELLGIYPDETPDDFVGFCYGVKGETFVYLLYYAIRPELRSTGIGSKALKALLEHYGDTSICFAYENPLQESDNTEQRERRRKFYLKNGLYETGWFAQQNGTEFIIASSKKEFDKEAFKKFMAIWAVETIGSPFPELYRPDGDDRATK